MGDTSGNSSSAQLTRAVARVLGGGGLGALATLVEAPRSVGAKVLFEAGGSRTGTTGDAALDDALARHAAAFLTSRAEARTFGVEEFAPALAVWCGARVM